MTLSIADLGVSTAKVAANAITTAKLAVNAVTETVIADLAVTTSKIADLAVTTAKIANGAVTGPKLDSNLAAGWIDAGESWTYTSPTQITVPSDPTTKYAKGDKIRLKQGGSYKYFYVTDLSSTLLSVTGGSDYSLSNSTITDNYYSPEATAVGFPQYFNWSPTYTGGGAILVSATTNLARFSISGKTVHVLLDTRGTTGTGSGGELYASAPVVGANSSKYMEGAASIWTSSYWSVGKVRAAGSVLDFQTGNNLPWADSALTYIQTSYSYELQ